MVVTGMQVAYAYFFHTFETILSVRKNRDF